MNKELAEIYKSEQDIKDKKKRIADRQEMLETEMRNKQMNATNPNKLQSNGGIDIMNSSAGFNKMNFKKDIIYKGADFSTFKTKNAVQTTHIMGKHITEFKRQKNSKIPDIFLLLVNYFESNPERMKTEGIFRVAGAVDTILEL